MGTGREEADMAEQDGERAPTRRKVRVRSEAAEAQDQTPQAVAPPAEVSDEVVALAADPAAELPEGEWVQEVESSYLQSKYTWVSVTAKRARELLDGSKPRVESLSDKPVTVALEELAQGKLYFERVQEGRR
jgi:DNA-directed RNA polymerase subunit omega